MGFILDYSNFRPYKILVSPYSGFGGYSNCTLDFIIDGKIYNRTVYFRSFDDAEAFAKHNFISGIAYTIKKCSPRRLFFLGNTVPNDFGIYIVDPRHINLGGFKKDVR